MSRVFRMKPSIWPDYRCSSGKPSPGPFPDTALSCNSRSGPSLPFPIVLRATLLIWALSRAEKRAMTVMWTCVSAILRPGSREMTRAAEPPRPVRPRFEPMPGNMAGPSLLQRPTRIVRDNMDPAPSPPARRATFVEPTQDRRRRIRLIVRCSSACILPRNGSCI